MAKEGKVSVTYVVNSSEYNKNIADMKKNMQLLNQQIKTSANEVNTYGKNIDSLKKQQTNINNALEQSKKIMTSYEQALSKNNNTLEKNKTKLAELAKQKESANKAYEEAISVYGKEAEETLKAKEALDKANEAYSKQEKLVNSNQNAIRNKLTQVEKLRQQQLNLEQQLEETNREIENQSNKFLNASKRFAEASTTLENLGGQISDLGGNLLALTAPLLALGTYSASVGTTFEKNMSTVQATASLTADEMDTLGERAKQLGADIKGANATDVAESYQYLALAGQSVAEMYETIEPYTKASIAYGEEQKTVTDLSTDSMSALQMATKDTTYYLNVLTKAQNSSNTTATQLMEAYIACGGTLANMNVPLEEATALLGRMADQGTKGSEAGNALNSILVNLMGTTSTTEGALKQLGVSAYDSGGNFRGLTTTLLDVKSAMAKCTQEEKDMIAAQLGGKTQLTALNQLLNGLDDGYDKLYNSVSNADGALDKMYETMSDNTAGNIEELKSKLEALGLAFSDNILPYVNKAIDAVKDIIDWFGNLSEENQQLIVDLGLITAATGGALKVLGSFTSGVGSLAKNGSKALEWLSKFTTTTTAAGKSVTVLKSGLGVLSGVSLTSLTAAFAAVTGAVATGVYAWHEYNDVMDSTCKKAYEDFGTMEKVIIKLTDANVKSKEEMIKTGAAYKDFNENVSEDFKKTAVEMRTKVQELNLELHEMNLDGVLDESEQQKVIDNVNSLCESAISAINDHYDEIQNSLSSNFNMDGILDENEATILQYYSDRKEAETKEVQAMQDDINEYLRKVREEGYILTAEDEKIIQNYYAEIARIELEAKANNEYEKAYAQSEFNQQALNLDNESAEKLLKSRKETYNKEVTETNAHYDALISVLKKGYEDMNAEQKAATDAKLIQYEEERKNELESAKRYYDEDIQYLKEHNANIIDEIDYYNGDLMDKRDKKNNEEFFKMKSHYEDLDKITADGMYKVYNTTTQSWDDLLVDIDEATGEIIALSKLEADERGIRAGEITGYNTEIAESMEETNKRQNQSIFDMQIKFDDYCKAVETGTLSQSEAWERIMTDVENGKIKISEFGYSSKEDFGKTVSILLDVAEKGGTAKDILTGLSKKDYSFNVNANGLENTKDNVKSLRQALAEIDGKSFSFNINQNNTTSGTTLTGGLRGALETGGTVGAGEQGIYNINESGIELIDNPFKASAYTLSEAIRGEYAYLPAHTKVTNATMTTQKMSDMIDAKLRVSLSAYLKEMNNILAKNTKTSGTNIHIDEAHFENKESEDRTINNVNRILNRFK